MTKTHRVGLCGCGCGQKTRVAPVNDSSKGWVKGEPLKFIKGHNVKALSGSESPNWKGGKQTTPQGYVTVWTPEGRKYEHVAIAERVLGRVLLHISPGHPDNEVVHHINGKRNDNRNSNLLICTHKYHAELHARLEASPQWPEFQPRVNHPHGQTRVGASGFKGVRKSRHGRWKAVISEG